MTQPQPPRLPLEDAYLYGAWIEDIRLDAWDLIVSVRYTNAVSEFYELEPQLNLLSCSIVFQAVGNRLEAEAFRQRWEASDTAWSLAAVAADGAGGFGLVTREAGELLVHCDACVLADVEAFEIDQRYATPVPIVPRTDSMQQFAEWQRNQYIEPLYAQGRLPRFAALFLGGNAALGLALWLLASSHIVSFQVVILVGVTAVVVWFGAMLVWAVRILRPKSHH